jgi:hypothetical protein
VEEICSFDRRRATYRHRQKFSGAIDDDGLYGKERKGGEEGQRGEAKESRGGGEEIKRKKGIEEWMKPRTLSWVLESGNMPP